MEATGAICSVGAGSERSSRRQASRGDISLLHLISQSFAFVSLLVASYLFFSHFVVQLVCVTGSSMWPTLGEADFYLVNRVGSLFRAPRRGDIVVIKDPTDAGYSVKRIIGAGGDHVELRGGAVYVNGERIEESYLPRGVQTFPFNSLTQTVQCRPDELYVLGDNRFYSSDSRSYGPVRRVAVLGRLLR